jgi:hypothetical protein
MAKRLSKRSLREATVALLMPSTERLQHGRIGSVGQILDAGGLIGSPFRAESMLERMERHHDIGAAERNAGEMFQDLFRLAHLDPLKSADLMREVRVAGPHGGNGIERARDRINDAVQALGGHNSPCGSCAWFVLGNEITIAEWARREGWGGHPLRPETAKGLLIGALGVLVKHFGL